MLKSFFLSFFTYWRFHTKDFETWKYTHNFCFRESVQQRRFNNTKTKCRCFLIFLFCLELRNRWTSFTFFSVTKCHVEFVFFSNRIKNSKFNVFLESQRKSRTIDKLRFQTNPFFSKFFEQKNCHFSQK